jgi:hypothetical protein
MRPPSILDVVRAVKAVAASHADVPGWWYAPPKRLRLAGERPSDRGERRVEIAIEGELPSSAHEAIAAELSRALHGAAVRVRAYRGRHDDGHLFRLLSADGTLRAS